MEVPNTDIVRLILRVLDEQDLVDIDDTRCTFCLIYFSRNEEIVLLIGNHIYQSK